MTIKVTPPISLRIRLRYPDVGTFVEKYAPNISRGGIFIQSRAPQPVGTKLRFELLLQDNTRLLKGEGHVVWVKDYDVSQPTQAHGMGVRFTSLDDDSQQMVEQVLRFKEGGQVRPIRDSATQEVRHLVTSAAPIDSEEPQQRQGTGMQQVVPQEPDEQHPDATLIEPMRPPAVAAASAEGGNGALLIWADEQLQALLQEAGVAGDVVDQSLARVLAGTHTDVSDIEELEELVGGESPEVDEDPDAARELLRQMLGAAPVPPVRELTTEAPEVRVRPRTDSYLEPYGGGEPAADVADGIDSMEREADSFDSSVGSDSFDNLDDEVLDSVESPSIDMGSESLDSIDYGSLDSMESSSLDSSVESDSFDNSMDSSLDSSMESLDGSVDSFEDQDEDQQQDAGDQYEDSEETPLDSVERYDDSFEAFSDEDVDEAEFEEELQQASAAIPDEQQLADLDLSEEDFEESLGGDVIFASRVPESNQQEQQAYEWKNGDQRDALDDSEDNFTDDGWRRADQVGSESEDPALAAYDEEAATYISDPPDVTGTDVDPRPAWQAAFEDADETETADVNMAVRAAEMDPSLLGPDPEEDEVFDALAGVRELRDRPPPQRPSSKSSEAVPTTESAEPPSLEALASRAKPATGVEEAVQESSGTFDKIDVVVDDDEGAAKPSLRAPKSGLFRRLFGKD